MDIKEFRNNNNREGKKRPEYPDEKDGTVNYKIYAVIGIIAVVLAAAIAMFININRFDIKKYIKPIYTGANGYASVRFDIDEAGLEKSFQVRILMVIHSIMSENLLNLYRYIQIIQI